MSVFSRVYREMRMVRESVPPVLRRKSEQNLSRPPTLFSTIALIEFAEKSRMIMRILTIGLVTGVFAAPCYAVDEEAVQSLYDQNCVSCHGTEIYTRKDRKVTSLPALETQVQRCETALGLRWFDDDIADMSQFLNRRYYHFKP